MRHMRPAGSPVRGLGLTACLAALALATAPAAAAQEEERPPPPLVPVDDALADALESGELTGPSTRSSAPAASSSSPASAGSSATWPALGSRRPILRPGRASRPALGRRRTRGERPPRAPHRRSVPIGHAYSVPPSSRAAPTCASTGSRRPQMPRLRNGWPRCRRPGKRLVAGDRRARISTASPTARPIRRTAPLAWTRESSTSTSRPGRRTGVRLLRLPHRARRRRCTAPSTTTTRSSGRAKSRRPSSK